MCIRDRFNVVYDMGIYDLSGFFDYVTGEKDYYFNYDDRDCAETVSYTHPVL